MSFFSPPQNIATEVYASLPDRYRRDRRSDWADANKGGAVVDSFLEGPSFDREGNLYVVDIPFGRVFRVDPDRTWSVVTEYEGWPNGLKIRRDGRIFITDYRLGVLELNPASGRIKPVLANIRSEGFKGVNDLILARNGDLFFTDHGQTGLQDASGRVYRWTSDGRLDCLIDVAPGPNGIVLNGAETHLYVAMTRSCQVWRIPLTRDSRVSKAQVFVQLSGGISGPDGLAMDGQDNLLVCDPGHGSVWVFDRLGEPLYRVRSCAGLATTNLAFGGKDMRELYITESESGQILRARMPVPGRPLVSHD
ncbi:MAG: SMP-30/gluconolactonase/LRE family protein [Rhodospirillaceae bacterium]|nr:SMP-30/gluconolactonase/LRE family protein [Rhodospirillaceae bacterium]